MADAPVCLNRDFEWSIIRAGHFANCRFSWARLAAYGVWGWLWGVALKGDMPDFRLKVNLIEAILKEIVLIITEARLSFDLK